MSWPQFDKCKMAAFWAMVGPLLPSPDEEKKTTVEEIIGRIREVEVQEKNGASQN